MENNEMLKDSYGRTVNYIRLSVTDRCNLQCLYCRQAGQVESIPHKHILSYEEMLELIQVARDLGVTKVRLTGGEPFVRRDFLAFLGLIKEHCPGMDVRVTTNATLLGGKIPALKHLGVTALNISLDTMDREGFHRITGRDFLDRVLGAVDDCLRYGLKTKINVVGLRGINDDQLPAFIEMARSKPVDVRFIEFMPMGGCRQWGESRVWPASEILKQARTLAELEAETEHTATDGPARTHAVKGGLGRIGVISPLTGHFCDTCNRLRFTADGRLRTCLFSDREYRLRRILRSPRLGRESLFRVLAKATERKPIGHEILEKRKALLVSQKAMSKIGG